MSLDERLQALPEVEGSFSFYCRVLGDYGYWQCPKCGFPNGDYEGPVHCRSCAQYEWVDCDFEGYLVLNR